MNFKFPSCSPWPALPVLFTGGGLYRDTDESSAEGAAGKVAKCRHQEETKPYEDNNTAR